jgi:hypothetical protein
MQDAIALYRDLGLSCYPTVFKEKRCMPGIAWTALQKRQPTVEELLEWHYNYSQDNGGPGYGIAIPTGFGAGTIVPYAIDCDQGVPQSLVDLHTTTIEHGGRGPCFVMTGPRGIGSARVVLELEGIPVELKGLGGSFLAPLSVYSNGTPYQFLPGLGFGSIKYLPPSCMDSLERRAAKPRLPRLLNAHGYDRLCLVEIMDPHHIMRQGECYMSLWLAYGLLQRENDRGKNANTKAYAREVVTRRNAMLEAPLKRDRLADIFRDKSLSHSPSCTTVRNTLSWVREEKLCWSCPRMEHHFLNKVQEAQQRGLDPLAQLVLLQIAVTGELSPTGIATTINTKDYRTIKSAMTRIMTAGCWPDNVDLPAKNAGDFDESNPSDYDSTSASSDR